MRIAWRLIDFCFAALAVEGIPTAMCSCVRDNAEAPLSGSTTAGMCALETGLQKAVEIP